MRNIKCIKIVLESGAESCINPHTGLVFNTITSTVGIPELTMIAELYKIAESYPELFTRPVDPTPGPTPSKEVKLELKATESSTPKRSSVVPLQEELEIGSVWVLNGNLAVTIIGIDTTILPTRWFVSYFKEGKSIVGAWIQTSFAGMTRVDTTKTEPAATKPDSI